MIVWGRKIMSRDCTEGVRCLRWNVRSVRSCVVVQVDLLDPYFLPSLGPHVRSDSADYLLLPREQRTRGEDLLKFGSNAN
jgi:hypothetical protein